MPVHRKRFRIEDTFLADMPIPSSADGELDPMHHEIMAELRAIRAQMANPATATAASRQAAAPNVAVADALLESYRAQIEQCEKLKVELDLIHDTISRAKREISVLHGNSFDSGEMSRVTGELGAVVGGTEQATQQILQAAESIGQAAAAMAGPTRRISRSCSARKFSDAWCRFSRPAISRTSPDSASTRS